MAEVMNTIITFENSPRVYDLERRIRTDGQGHPRWDAQVAGFLSNSALDSSGSCCVISQVFFLQDALFCRSAHRCPLIIILSVPCYEHVYRPAKYHSRRQTRPTATYHWELSRRPSENPVKNSRAYVALL